MHVARFTIYINDAVYNCSNYYSLLCFLLFSDTENAQRVMG